MKLPRLSLRKAGALPIVRSCEGHPGIRLRISVPSGVVVDATSEHLYLSAKYGGISEPCNPDCPPGCDKHGWYDLIAGGGMGTTEWSTVPLKIEVKPVRLIEAADEP